MQLKPIWPRLMKPTACGLCASHPAGVSDAFPSEDQGKRGTVRIQSTPRVKPGPWKWDLWGSQLITAPIEVSPTFCTGKSQRVPTPLAIRRFEGLWKALHVCAWGSGIFTHSNQVIWPRTLLLAHSSEDTHEQQIESEHFRVWEFPKWG